MPARLWTAETEEAQQVLWITGGVECVEGRSEFVSRRCVCVLTRQQQEGRFLWALKCNVVVGEWVGVVAGR